MHHTRPELAVIVKEKYNPEPLPQLTALHTTTNGLNFIPYIPKDQGRAQRLLEAIEAINRARSTAE